MFKNKYISNYEICNRAILYINEYDKRFPAVEGLAIPSSGNQAEAYVISNWIFHKFSSDREFYYINQKMLFLLCRESLRYVSQKNIMMFIDFLLKPESVPLDFSQ